MIYSTDLCPLCGSKLTQNINSYYCGCGAGSGLVHYINIEVNKQSNYVRMTILQYYIMHQNNITSVSKMIENSHLSKYLFTVPLLDMDYSQTNLVILKFQILTLFS